MDKCGVKKVTKALIALKWVNELHELGYLEKVHEERIQVQTNFYTGKPSGKVKIQEHFKVSDMGMRSIEAAKPIKNLKTTQSLF